ncbi:hypothetical protein BHE74_00029335 [Ensete ventricosum]|nr:hypothetical protein BHE74_00029335 [Ensete ventricosum]
MAKRHKTKVRHIVTYRSLWSVYQYTPCTMLITKQKIPATWGRLHGSFSLDQYHLTWLITGRGIARKVKNATFSDNQIKDIGVTLDWPGLPAGVKFDPSDAELLEHLAGKTGLENSKLHILIDEFIAMLEEDEGICYTHPENLPGKEGSSHFYFSCMILKF